MRATTTNVALLAHDDSGRLAVVRTAAGFELPATTGQGVPRALATGLCAQLGVTADTMTLTHSPQLDRRARNQGDRAMWLFDVDAHGGTLATPPGAAGAWWIDRLDLQVYAQRTVNRASGLTSPAEWADFPGIRPDHLPALAHHKWVDIPDDTLTLLRRFARTGTAA